ncbi:unnamed protein product [Closterium sp. NIES-53]
MREGRLLPDLRSHPDDDYSSGVAAYCRPARLRVALLGIFDFVPLGEPAQADLAASPAWLHWLFPTWDPPWLDPVLVYVDDLVFATLDRRALASVKEELQRRHTCTDLGELQHYLSLQITKDRAARTITLSQSHMVEQILTRFRFLFSKVQLTPLAVDHGLTAPPSDESFESSGPYPKLVGCLMSLMTCTRPDLAYPLSVLARFVAPGRHRPSHWYAAKRVAKYVASTSGMGLVLGGKQPVTLTGFSDSSWANDAETRRSTQGYSFSLGTGVVSWRSTRASYVSGSSCEAEVYAAAMVAQELRWLSFLLTDLGERPRSSTTGLLSCCQHGQAFVRCVVSEANTAYIFTKALPPCDHQRFCTQLGLVPALPHLLTVCGDFELHPEICLVLVDWSCDPCLFLLTGHVTLACSQTVCVLETHPEICAGAGGAGAGDPRVGGAGAQGPVAAGAGAGGTGAGGTGAGGTVQRQPFFVPPPPPSLPPPGSVLCQVLRLPSSTGPNPPLLCPPPHQSQPQLQPDSPLPAPSPYNEQTDSLTERREPASCPASPVCAVCTGRRVPRTCPPRVLLVSPALTLWHFSDLVRAASPTVTRLLATVVTDPSFESTTASALVVELVDFAAACRLDYAASLVAESQSDCPPSVGGECALGTNVLEDKQEDFECLTAVVPHLVAMLLAPEGDPDAPDISTLCSYIEAITVPPPGANIVNGMWIFRVKRLPGSPPVFKARYGSLHEEIWLRRPPGFTGSFPAGTQWSLRQPVYGLHQAPCEWHDTLRTTLATLGFAPSTADPSLFLRTDTSLPPFYILVYIDDLAFAIADTEALALVLQRFGFWFSSPQSTPLPTRHSLSAPPSDESIEPSGPYPELVGCLMYLMTCTRPDLAYSLSILAHYVAPRRHRPEHWEAAKRVLRYLCNTSDMGLVLGGQGPVVLTGHADAS